MRKFLLALVLALIGWLPAHAQIQINNGSKTAVSVNIISYCSGSSGCTVNSCSSGCTYTPSTGMVGVEVRVVGPGGGGGAGSGASVVGGPGSSGASCSGFFTPTQIGSSATVTVPAGGAGGAAGGANNGSPGSAVTVVSVSLTTLLSCNGGLGGTGVAAGNGAGAAAPAACSIGSGVYECLPGNNSQFTGLSGFAPASAYYGGGAILPSVASQKNGTQPGQAGTGGDNAAGGNGAGGQVVLKETIAQ